MGSGIRKENKGTWDYLTDMEDSFLDLFILLEGYNSKNGRVLGGRQRK